MKIAAKKLGLTLGEYNDLVNSGLKWCIKCRTWKNKTEFGRDASRHDGLNSRCFPCRITTTNGPTKRERINNKAVGLAWCRRCNKWLSVDLVRGGLCQSHRAEYDRERYQSDETYRLERKEHSHSRKRDLYPIPADVQQEILRDFGGRCAYCENKATSWDHVIPVSLGGNSTPGNVIPCCQSCNSSKKDAELFRWIETTDKQNLHPKLLDILSLAECVPY